MFKLDRQAQVKLLELARNSIHDYLLSVKPADYKPTHPGLKERCGVFVTLKESGRLRGCIGCLAAEKPLCPTIADCAVAAAVSDPRFPPLCFEELNQVTIEISVLSPLQTLERVEDICIGKHGLMVSQGSRRGLLLPQVATENHWDREDFLSNTCLKAGLPPDAWQHSAKLEIFTAEVFAEVEAPSGHLLSH